MKKKCSRCNLRFECQNDNIMNCDCINIIIPKYVYGYIKKNYTDCLCVKCIEELKTERQRSPRLSAVPK